MPVISVDHLIKEFKTHKKEPGLGGSVKALFHREYETIQAVKDISFTIEEGELIGFIGPNGAGKTTTLKTLSGLLYPTSGNVSVLGYKPWERKHQYLKQIALVMGQKNQLWWDLPPIETFQLHKALYDISDSRYKKTLNELADLLDIKDILNIPVRKLSLGQRMKCELIAALIHSPKVLFLDEPTIGLDVVMQKNLRDFIRDYNKTYNATILLTSHYMEDVRQLCDRVIIIDHGQILYDGRLDEIVKQYANEKILTVAFEKPVDDKKLEKLGKVILYDTQKAVISVPIDNSNQIAAKLLETFPVEDLTIQEPDIEEIVRDIFVKSQRRNKES